MSIFRGGKFGTSKNASWNPSFSFLDTDTRGHDVLTQNFLGESGLLWVADDRDGASWPEHFATADCTLTQAGSDPGAPGQSMYSAGGRGDKEQTFNASLYFEGATAKCDPGTDDLIWIWAGNSPANNDVIWDTRGAGLTSGMYLYRSVAGAFESAIKDGTNTLAYNPSPNPQTGRIVHAYAVDRSRSDGAVSWENGTYNQSAAGDPTAVNGSVGNGGKLIFGTNPVYGNRFLGTMEFFGLWHSSDWLDMSDTSIVQNAVAGLLAGMVGNRFSVYAGSVDYPDIQSGTRAYDVDGTAFTPSTGIHLLENEDGTSGETFAEFRRSQSQIWEIPSTEIPVAPFTVVIQSISQAGNAFDSPIISWSDGTSNENFEIGFDTSGYLVVKCDSASGDNGYVRPTGDVCDGTRRKISVSVGGPNGLDVQIDGVGVGSDSTYTLPQSPDRMYVGANYDASVFADSARIYAGDNLGIQIYPFARH